MANKLTFTLFILVILSLNACSSPKKGMQTLGSLIGVGVIAAKGGNSGEYLLGSMAGGFTGQMIHQVIK